MLREFNSKTATNHKSEESEGDPRRADGRRGLCQIHVPVEARRAAAVVSGTLALREVDRAGPSPEPSRHQKQKAKKS